MPTFDELEKATFHFFQRHWNAALLGTDAPCWSEKWWLDGSPPNFEKLGVYAFFRGNEVIYIGSGMRRGSGRYENHGIGTRMLNYFKREQHGLYSLKSEKLLKANV